MENKLLFGAAYYIEYMPEERLAEDLRLMKAASINVIRIAESTWAVEEPRPGQFDFSKVIRVIEEARKVGIDVIIGTPTYAIPSWLAALDPTILMGRPYGRRQIMDITNPTYRYYAERILRELLSRTAHYENVIGFQIDNETKHYGVNTPEVLAGFRKWLKDRFGTADAVNEAFGLFHWSNSVSSFEDLPDPKGTVNGSYACAFEEYRRELAVDFLRWQKEIAEEYKREDQFITHNFDYDWHSLGSSDEQDGYSDGIQPDMDVYAASKLLSLVGTDVYCPAADLLTGREIAFAGDVMRPLGGGRYLVLESQSQAFTGWLPYPGQLKLMALSHLASGAIGMMYWPWMSIHAGIESYWKGILSHDGLPGETYEEVAEIGDIFRKLSSVLPERTEKAEIAMMVSPRSLHAERYFPNGTEGSYNEVLKTFHRALYEQNLSCDLLYEEVDFSGYKLVIFPQLYAAEEGLVRRVRGYVADGGCVLAGPRSFFADENLKIRPDLQPHGLTDVFGVHYSRFTKSDGGRWMELLEENGADLLARYDHRFWGKYGAAAKNRFGKGMAFYLGMLPEEVQLKGYLRQAVLSAGIRMPDITWPVVMKKRENVLFLLNYSGEEARVSCPVRGRECLTDRSIAAEETITLSPYGAAVILTESINAE